MVDTLPATRDVLSQAAHAFLDRHREAFQLSPAYDVRNVAFGDPIPTDVWTVLPGHQQVGDVRLLGHDVTFVFDRDDGMIVGVNGTFLEVDDYAESSAVDCGLVAEIVSPSLDYVVDLTSITPMTRADGTHYCNVTLPELRLPGAIERMVDAENSSAVWHVTMPNYTMVVDEQTGNIIEKASNFRHSASNVNITHRDYSSTNVNNPLATPDSTVEQAHYGEFLGTCTWELSYVEGSINNLDRVKDDDHSETSRSQSCGTTPSFNSTSGANLDQQDAYFWVKSLRDWLAQNVWDTIGSPSSSNVEVNIHMGDPYCAACYNPFFTDIYFHRDNDPDFDSLWHEYAHHFVWTYGHLDGTCSFGVDESDQINETVADLITYILSTNGSYIGTDYNTTWNRIGGSGANEKHEATVRSYRNQCSSDVHFFGDFFEQAFWEVLHNFDCSQVTCSSTSTWGSSIGWASRSEARVALARGIANALAACPSTDVIYDDIGFWMTDYIIDVYGSTLGNNVRDVFNHHGMSL